jgi:DNA-binding MarR family transcriptional regulator
MDCINTLPQADQVEIKWNKYILQEESKVAKDLNSLNTSQKKILIAIAHGMVKELTGKEMLKRFDLSSAAILKSLTLLEEQDYLEKREGEYRIVDPLIKSSLLLFYPKT